LKTTLELAGLLPHAVIQRNVVQFFFDDLFFTVLSEPVILPFQVPELGLHAVNIAVNIVTPVMASPCPDVPLGALHRPQPLVYRVRTWTPAKRVLKQFGKTHVRSRPRCPPRLKAC
jgi:hypothetical protein